MKLFAINGISYSGKDTFCNKVKEQNSLLKVKDPNHPLELAMWEHEMDIRVISTIDPIKEIYSQFFGWDGIKTDIHRKNLNMLKGIWIEVSNGPHEWLKEQIQECWQADTEILFVMVREFEEMMDAVQLGKELIDHGETIQIVRYGLPVPPVEQEFLDSHPADYRYDWTVINPTTDNPFIPNLTSAAKQFLTSTKKEGTDLVWNPIDEEFVEWIIND